jgi:EAL domain-containing protein (putative c-di-GMP-specific phosphodiesterase class I)
LIRWRHPDLGLVSPAQFIPMAEETGLIIPIGEWVLNSACAQLRAWREGGLTPVPVAVNLSAKQFHQQNIAAVVMRALQDHAVDPRLLELEITESTAMRNAEATSTTLRNLKALGVRIAIDDFGTGYSSLSYLKRFPIDSLKIDRSFVTDLPGNQDDASIAQAIITMAHALRLKVIAEGVENKAQLEFMTANGCDEIQGFYFSRPLPAELCTQLLRDKRKLPLLRVNDSQAAPAVVV